ncbi:MAG: hypothetical protein WHT27_00695 [candidate division WOR-3 bacterium]|jgi:quercetin dioxygenase-like cupin family protein
MNIFENIPFQEENFGYRKLFENGYCMLLQIALNPKQSVKEHNANSFLTIIPVMGEVEITVNGIKSYLKEGTLFNVNLYDRMLIENTSDKQSSLLIFKAPHPDSIKKDSQ